MRGLGWAKTFQKLYFNVISPIWNFPRNLLPPEEVGSWKLPVPLITRLTPEITSLFKNDKTESHYLFIIYIYIIQSIKTIYLFSPLHTEIWNKEKPDYTTKIPSHAAIRENKNRHGSFDSSTESIKDRERERNSIHCRVENERKHDESRWVQRRAKHGLSPVIGDRQSNLYFIQLGATIPSTFLPPLLPLPSLLCSSTVDIRLLLYPIPSHSLCTRRWSVAGDK